ncbi:MAG: DUF3431 domain-containing protein [Verrucomicrobiota bacterium]
MSEQTLDLVISHFAEDLNWLKRVPKEFRCFVYHKGESNTIPEIRNTVFQSRIENVGREAHTYIHHIVTQYDDLSDITVFLQGHPFDHCHDLHARLRELATKTNISNDGFTWLGFIIDTDDAMGRRLFVPWSKNVNQRELDINQRYRKIFQTEGQDDYRFFPGGQFIVSSDLIRSKEMAFYKRMLSIAEDDSDFAYCVERFWDQVFGCSFVTEEMMNGLETVYLKQIKRLNS